MAPEPTAAPDTTATAAQINARVPLKIRRATLADEEALSRICLLTADAGSSAEHLHDHPELPGLVYAVPYVHLPTTWGFVLETEPTTFDNPKPEVVGYILGSTDTRAYEQAASSTWWPPLQSRYNPEDMTKPGDVHYSKLLRDMHTAPEECVASSKAHLHIDILAAWQRQGWGKRLIGRAVEFLRDECGLEGVWLGMDPRNVDARKFYERLGFSVVPGGEDNYMCLKFVDWKY